MEMETKNDIVTIAKGGALGTAGGAVVYSVIGGIGLAAAGTAFALPVIVIGTGLGIAASGFIVLGKRLERMKAKKDEQ